MSYVHLQRNEKKGQPLIIILLGEIVFSDLLSLIIKNIQGYMNVSVEVDNIVTERKSSSFCLCHQMLRMKSFRKSSAHTCFLFNFQFSV